MKAGYFLGCFAVFSIFPALAVDWPRYLGPDGNARVAGELGSGFKADVLWEKRIGTGCAGIVVSGDRAVTFGNLDGKDVVQCFDAASGKRLWRYAYDESLSPKLYDGGPNATPTIDSGRVYTLSRTGNLFCFSLEDGKVQWHQHYQSDFDGKEPSWGYSASPVVRGDELYCLPCGRDAAVFVLDKASGKLKRTFGKARQRPGYATPVFFEHQGKDMMAAFHGRFLVAYDLDRGGREAFDFMWRTSYDVNASNPQYLDGRMFIASGYGMGYAVLDVGGAEPELLHRNRDRRMIFQNSILLDGDIVGVFGDKNIDAELIRMDMKSGEVRWRERLPGTRGSSLMVGDELVVLTETGHLVVGTPEKTGWKEAGRKRVLNDGVCWAPISYADGMVFAKSNNGKAVAVRMK
jgi:outer membrane protein assembly factor BamB